MSGKIIPSPSTINRTAISIGTFKAIPSTNRNCIELLKNTYLRVPVFGKIIPDFG